MSYKFTPPSKQSQAVPQFPERIQRKIDIYKTKGLEYLWQRDVKDRLEFGFQALINDDIKRQKEKQKEGMINAKPTFRREILSIYRVRDDNDEGNKEWITWYEMQYVKDRENQEQEFDDLYGVEPEPVVKKEFDRDGNLTNLYVTRTLPKFTTPWSIENLENLLKASSIPVTQFIVAPAGNDYSKPMADGYMQRQAIGNLEDFKNGTYDELHDFGSKGFTNSKSPQLEQYRQLMKLHSTEEYKNKELEDKLNSLKQQMQQQEQQARLMNK